MKRCLLALCLLLPSFAGVAMSIEVDVTLPTMDVAEYHAPYVAIWLQDDKKQVTNLALWYDKAMRNDEGLQWLKDLRQWWRRSGRNLSLPVDSFTGATRKSGRYQLNLETLNSQLANLPTGHYELFVEAVREVGGRELISIPFSLPIAKKQVLRQAGQTEVAELSLKLQP